MGLIVEQIAGSDALTVLDSRRKSYRETGDYPFLIGDAEEAGRVREAAEFNTQSFEEIVRGAAEVNLDQWIAERRLEAEEYEFSAKDLLGNWPGEVTGKGAISLHRDILTGEIKPEVFPGTAAITEPWQLPAVVKFGGWNECPEAEVQCAFYRRWQTEFDAQVVGMSGDIVECVVGKPPVDRATALDLAWQQYWYCADIVDQGGGSISNLAATLLDSPYWFFWWD